MAIFRRDGINVPIATYVEVPIQAHFKLGTNRDNMKPHIMQTDHDIVTTGILPMILDDVRSVKSLLATCILKNTRPVNYIYITH